MDSKFVIYNTQSRKKEIFTPIHPGAVGMYVCGPTVYGDAHLGHARPAITFDILFRYLKHLGLKVRYVRNITDVGHLVNDGDEGEDKIAKKAKLDALEPMEVVQQYTNSYHKNMNDLNVLPPSIEPTATGHIIEQIEVISQLVEKGFAYVSNGSVYFDVRKYASVHSYGELSGRKIEDMLVNTRELDGQSEKRFGLDFALWKNAQPEHIMRWPSPWGEGFPGWHTECTAMSSKYLGDQFDIHGGGMDLMFPHHEAELAQAKACHGHNHVNYWMHNNMITINGQKMGKSLGNFITLDQLFEGKHALLEQAYDPMTIRFFILQAHYRSPLDFSNSALQAAEKGYQRLMQAIQNIEHLTPSKNATVDIEALRNKCYDAINDDLNTPILIAHLFDGVKTINLIKEGTQKATQKDIDQLKELFNHLAIEILGLQPHIEGDQQADVLSNVMDLLLDIRSEAKTNKDWATSDKIRDQLKAAGLVIKDTKDGAEWHIQ
ncbi:cysteine--tRNA ligase [Halosquirtibacter laminarini]|uniref:Cysteine--tRNA ligase n=1 Tax=Halosquirtibacter laminarini TaxID=3374600 RepID=A0AC61NN05_9BACT|nr:cysteine--tRNA ligase [Prolixibacteraceae bacterium]